MGLVHCRGNAGDFLGPILLSGRQVALGAGHILGLGLTTDRARLLAGKVALLAGRSGQVALVDGDVLAFPNLVDVIRGYRTDGEQRKRGDSQGGDNRGPVAPDKDEASMKRKRGKKAALKKLEEYFGDGSRMRYAEFRKTGVPIGSGSIESAIRRVVNLRIKSPGTFWKRDNVERMIFLRCQVIVGRWETLWRRHCESMPKSLQDGDFHILQKAA
jgi:hypothetical protein